MFKSEDKLKKELKKELESRLLSEKPTKPSYWTPTRKHLSGRGFPSPFPSILAGGAPNRILQALSDLAAVGQQSAEIDYESAKTREQVLGNLESTLTKTLKKAGMLKKLLQDPRYKNVDKEELAGFFNAVYKTMPNVYSDYNVLRTAIDQAVAFGGVEIPREELMKLEERITRRGEGRAKPVSEEMVETGLGRQKELLGKLEKVLTETSKGKREYKEKKKKYEKTKAKETKKEQLKDMTQYPVAAPIEEAIGAAWEHNNKLNEVLFKIEKAPLGEYDAKETENALDDARKTLAALRGNVSTLKERAKIHKDTEENKEYEAALDALNAQIIKLNETINEVAREHKIKIKQGRKISPAAEKGEEIPEVEALPEKGEKILKGKRMSEEIPEVEKIPEAIPEVEEIPEKEKRILKNLFREIGPELTERIIAKLKSPRIRK